MIYALAGDFYIIKNAAQCPDASDACVLPNRGRVWIGWNGEAVEAVALLRCAHETPISE